MKHTCTTHSYWFTDDRWFPNPPARVVILRKLSLGALIIGVGFAASLPFRRPEPTKDASLEASPTDELSDRSPLTRTSLEMLVEEVTEDVKAPVLYAPEARWPNPQYVKREIQMPLTYEDLAVPIDRGPEYAKRFNAIAASSEPAPSAAIAPPVNSQPVFSQPNPDPAGSAAASIAETPPASQSPKPRGHSVLAAAPYPSLPNPSLPTPTVDEPVQTGKFQTPTEAKPDTPARERHWIRQPSS
ncbi:hypothetical protein [Stieleria varia]|uniref:Uncharacterized protein n=1 Tax=Stieleria varia TaxID=2528005 RepID=A0A5C6AEP8_9BACT|nr:hypothetical protein [Stieleria varia]TWT98512.1 hypothetical protein Pla52n_50260 [Stieleria varia]